MSCDCQKNIKKPIDDGSTVGATASRNPIGDGLLKTTAASSTVGIFYTLRISCISKACLDAMDIMKLAGGIVGGVLVKDYAVYKKWINDRYNSNKILWLLRAIKLHDTIG